MALALRRYRKLLLASGLLDAAELRAFERSLPAAERPSSPIDLSQALVAAGKLTVFQAAEIDAGRASTLVLGNYVLLDRIGAGGMGQVFKAWHRRMQRTVAVKMLPDRAAAGENSIARFRREILSAAQLTHPNIVAAYDADEAQKIHFLVMEFVDGPNLSDVVRQQGPLPIAQAIRFVLDAARGLAYAHGRGVVHRDVKPSNLIVDPVGTVKVLDLGLARPATVATGAELTMVGDVVGTLEYMAPEQAAGASDIDCRADIYGLGCTLYRLLTGELPYRGGSTSALIAAHRDEKIPSLRTCRSDVPRSLDVAFKRMVAKHPEDRFQTMDEVIGALERVRVPDRRSAIASPAPVVADDGADGSGDDLMLVSSAASNVVFQSLHSDGPPREANHSPAELVVADKPGGRSPPVSPLLALAALAAAMAAITALAWFDADRTTAVTTGTSRHQADESLNVGELAQRWAKSLQLPLSMTNSLGMQFVLIPPGGEAQDSTSPGIATPFYYGVHEVTVSQYRQFLAATGYRTANRGASALAASVVLGERFQGDRRPATDLTAADAQAFCHWLSQYEAASYRVPTQSEWAYACRAGATTMWWFGDGLESLGRFAWYQSNSGGRMHQVGLLEANPLGLHDLLGNAAEWCVVSDRQSAVLSRGAASQYMLCGGNWSSPATAFDHAAVSVNASTTGGLRLVLELPLEARWPRRSATSQRRATR